MAGAGNGIVAEAVTEENYEYWSVLVENYLRGKGIWDVVVDPNAPDDRNKDRQRNDAKALHVIQLACGCEHLFKITHCECETVRGRSKDWQRNDAKALHVIQLACGSEHLSKITHCKTARDAWNELKSFFRQDSKADQQGKSGRADDEDYRDLYAYVERGDVKGLQSYGDLSKAITSALFPGNSTLIHVAVIGDRVDIVRTLVSKAPKEVLEMEDDDGYTALALAAAFTGNKSVAELLIGKDEEKHLLRKKAERGVHKDLIPVVMAAEMGHKEMTRYLYAQIVAADTEILQENNYEHAVSLLHRCINSEIFGVALHLLQICCRELPLAPSESDGLRPLLALAQMPSAFESGNQYGWCQRWIYNNLRVPDSLDLTYYDDKTRRENNDEPITIKITSHIDLIQPQTKSKTERLCGKLPNLAPLKILGLLLRLLLNCRPILNCSAIKGIYERKLLHYQVLEILSCMCERISRFNTSKLKEVSAYVAMLQAAKNGIIEFIELMSKAKPELLWESVDQTKRGIFAHAILHRRREVFELIHKLNGRKKKITCSKDAFGNNLLHLAALLGPSSDLDRRFGAALQMQRELQWFKAMQDSVHPKCKEETNNDGKRPHEVFAKSHKELVKEAEKWAKDTAGSFIIVGTLIITIIFAAAFTLPGGNDQNNGKPMFLKDKKFTAFIMADAFALFTSSSSVLIFIWVLTSRYAEKDFLANLPCKLFFGLLTLSISVVSMFGAFCVAFFLMLQGYPYVSWTAMVLAVATVVLILVPSQFRLFSQILGSTVGFKPILTDKNNTCWPLRLCHYAFSAIRFCIGC